MDILCLGLNHQTAPVEIREIFAVSESLLGEHAGRVCEVEGVEESVVLSTCNRTEYYAAAVDCGVASDQLREFLQSQAGSRLKVEHLYEKQQLEADAFAAKHRLSSKQGAAQQAEEQEGADEGSSGVLI